MMVMAMETVAVALDVVTHGAVQDPRWPPPGSSTTASPASGSAAPSRAQGRTAPSWYAALSVNPPFPPSIQSDGHLPTPALAVISSNATMAENPTAEIWAHT